MKNRLFFIGLLTLSFNFKSQLWVPATPFPGATGNISNAAIDETRVNCLSEFNGDLIVCGNFSSIGGIVSHGIAKWNGNTWSNLGPGNYLQNKVTDICEYNSKLFVSTGDLKSWDGFQWSNFTMFNSSTGNNITVTARELHLFDDELYIITQNSNLLKYDGTTFLELPSLNGYPYCIEDFNGELYVGTNSGVYKYSNQSWINCTGIVTNNPIIVDLESFNGELYAIGYFSTIGGLSVQNLAKFNGTAWFNLIMPSGFWPQVENGGEVADVSQNSLKVIDNNLYVAAYFGTMQGGNFDPNPLYKFNGVTWIDLALNCTSTQDLGLGNTCVIYQGELFVGGSFTTISNSPWDPVNSDVNDNCFIKLDPNLSNVTENSLNFSLIYPNPTSNNITIQGKEGMNQNFKIFDQMGKEVFMGKLTGTETEVNLSFLSKGMYTLKIEGNYQPAQIVKE